MGRTKTYDGLRAGVHFAITAEQERLLLAADSAGDTESLEALLEDIEEGWDDDDLTVDTDKEWDAIHRCLGDGTLDPDGPPYPLSHVILGGRDMHDDYYVVTSARTRCAKSPPRYARSTRPDCGRASTSMR